MPPRAPRSRRAARAARAPGRPRSGRRARACAAAPRSRARRARAGPGPRWPAPTRPDRRGSARAAPARRRRRSAPSDFAAWARTGQSSDASAAIRAGTHAAPPTRPRARAAEIRTSIESLRSSSARAARGAWIAGEAQGPREARVELDLGTAGREPTRTSATGEGPSSQRREDRLDGPWRSEPLDDPLRRQHVGDQAPDQHLGGARRGGAGESRAGDEAHVGVGVAQQRDDLLDDGRDAGSGEQQRGAGAGGRAAGPRLGTQARQQSGRLHRLADRARIAPASRDPDTRRRSRPRGRPGPRRCERREQIARDRADVAAAQAPPA